MYKVTFIFQWQDGSLWYSQGVSGGKDEKAEGIEWLEVGLGSKQPYFKTLFIESEVFIRISKNDVNNFHRFGKKNRDGS